MKTTVDIPEQALRDAMHFAAVTTKRAAILTALTDYNRRQRMTRLARHLGSCREMITPSELAKLRKTE
ncbi:MAG: type II toxin-antitoxin system VapB family antitoxin [Kiritimatiellia bacterium]